MTDRFGWEVGYTGLYGMFGEATAVGDDNITFPDPIGGDLVPADSVRAGWRSSTNYFGPQIGRWGRREWCRWAVEGWWKAAVCGTSAYQAQDPIVSSITGEVRPGGSATDAGVGFLGGLNGTLIYRLTEVWGIRAGYNCYWLTNAALAPTQFDFGVLDDSASRINDNGGLFLHGANLGVEARR